MSKSSRGRLTDHELSHVNPSIGWVIETDIQINGRHVTPGTQLTINGESNRVEFVRKVYNPRNGATWIDARQSGRHRSFYIEDVKRVHSKKRVPR